jgi:hypothetical protein
VISLATEDRLVDAVFAAPNACVLPPVQSSFDDKGRILVTRDKLRIYLHRQIYRRVFYDLPHFLLKKCDTFGCVNPWHYFPSDKPYNVVTHCRNGHVYGVRDRTPWGAHRCHVCAHARLVRRRRGGLNGWQREVALMFCPQGHPYVEGNLYTYPTPSGGIRRKCRTCTRARAAGLDPANVIYP